MKLLRDISNAFSSKNILKFNDWFRNFVDFVTLGFLNIIDSIAQPILLVLISIIEIHRINIGVKFFEVDGWSLLIASTFVLGFFVTNVKVSTAEYEYRKENGFKVEKITTGLVVKFLKFVWIRIFGLSQYSFGNLKLGFKKEVHYTTEIDNVKKLEMSLLLSASLFSAIGSLKDRINEYENIKHYEALWSILTQSDLPTTVEFVLVFTLTFIMFIFGVITTQTIVFRGLQKKDKETESVKKEEEKFNFKLIEFQSTIDNEIYNLTKKYKDKLHEDDYVILKDNEYQIFDGKARLFIQSRNRDKFKGHNTLITNLENMLEER